MAEFNNNANYNITVPKTGYVYFDNLGKLGSKVDHESTKVDTEI